MKNMNVAYAFLSLMLASSVVWASGSSADPDPTKFSISPSNTIPVGQVFSRATGEVVYAGKIPLNLALGQQHMLFAQNPNADLNAFCARETKKLIDMAQKNPSHQIPVEVSKMGLSILSYFQGQNFEEVLFAAPKAVVAPQVTASASSWGSGFSKGNNPFKGMFGSGKPDHKAKEQAPAATAVASVTTAAQPQPNQLTKESLLALAREKCVHRSEADLKNFHMLIKSAPNAEVLEKIKKALDQVNPEADLKKKKIFDEIAETSSKSTQGISPRSKIRLMRQDFASRRALLKTSIYGKQTAQLTTVLDQAEREIDEVERELNEREAMQQKVSEMEKRLMDFSRTLSGGSDQITSLASQTQNVSAVAQDIVQREDLPTMVDTLPATEIATTQLKDKSDQLQAQQAVDLAQLEDLRAAFQDLLNTAKPAVKKDDSPK